jgi:serine/threonine protein kinase
MSGTVESGAYCAYKNGAGPLSGQCLGNYRLLRIVGTGAMGAVYEAINQYLGRRVAVKVLHNHHAHDEGFVARFFREARASNRLTHPGVVDVFEVGKSPAGQPYIVMEFLEGETLARRFAKSQQSTLPARRAHRVCVLRIAKQLAATLGVLHARGVIHRDLKPDNIYLCPDLSMEGGIRAKILDFGVAKIKHDSSPDLFSPHLGINDRHQTAIGDVLGTPTYMAPEQWLGSATVTDRADVYALGGILFELLAGHPPFPTQVIGDLIRSHLYVDAPNLSQQAADVPKELSQLIASMLHKSPEGRPSMEQVTADIDRVLINEDAMQRLAERPAESESETIAVFLPASSVRPVQSFAPPMQATEIKFNSRISLISQQPQASRSSVLTTNESKHYRYRTLIIAAAAWLILTCALLAVVIWRISHPSSVTSQIDTGIHAGGNSLHAPSAERYIAANTASDTNTPDPAPTLYPPFQVSPKIHIPTAPTRRTSVHFRNDSRLRVRCNRHVDRRFTGSHFLSMSGANHARISH